MMKTTPPRRIHITAWGSSAKQMLTGLGVKDVPGMVQLVQQAVGARYQVTASERMILAREVDEEGGRFDDAARVREVESVFADDGVAALVTIRGGAWFTRILDRINWDLLGKRKRTLHLFGFSEMTTLITIAGQYPQVVGLYDLGPGFLESGMKRWALKNLSRLTNPQGMSDDLRAGFAAGWANAKYPEAFKAFFAEVADLLDGQPSPRVPTGRLLQGRLPARRPIVITGGNLSLLVAMLGSRFMPAIETQSKWLAIEDLNEACDKVDRMIAALRLAGLLDRADGLILGDFHSGDTEQSDAVFNILRHHLPRGSRKPVVALDNFGHIWPLAPLPFHRPVTLCCRTQGRGRPSVRIEACRERDYPPTR
ncbi:MAG: LD-carboxypeptidase [Phycisphaerae bacterium]|nr:LD-carboxypeptidase [Phycisphaerae bacterium]